MTQVETSRPDASLTGGNTQESTKGSTDTAGETTSTGSENWQAALQKAREREKAIKEELEDTRNKLKVKEEEDKKKKLADLSEAERYKAEAQEEAMKRGKLELTMVVSEALEGRNVPRPIADLLKKSPWAIPEVSEELGDEFTWDEAVTSVKKHLPSYVDSLVVNSTAISDEPKKVDSERSVDSSAVIRDHIYTQVEVAEIAKDPKLYEKHREAILTQLSKGGGKLPQ